MLVGVLAGEGPVGGTCPVATVVISGGEAGDQFAGSPEVKVLVGWVKTWSAPTGGRANQPVVTKANRSQAPKLTSRHGNRSVGCWKCREHQACSKAASLAKELDESNRWTSRGLGGRHVEKVCQQKHGSAPGSPRRRAMTHSEDSAYKPPGGEIGLCLGVGRMGPVKARMDRDNITRTGALQRS